MNHNNIFSTTNSECKESKKLLSLGVLFKQTNKTNPKAPDLTGTLDIEPHDFAELLKQFDATSDAPVECRLAAWLKTGKNGQQYLTVQLSPPFKKQAQPTSTKADDKSSLDEFLGGRKDGDGQ